MRKRPVPLRWVGPGPRPYTDADRARLLAPITITHFGGKSHATAPLVKHAVDHPLGDRYGLRGDWSDLDRM